MQNNWKHYEFGTCISRVDDPQFKKAQIKQVIVNVLVNKPIVTVDLYGDYGKTGNLGFEFTGIAYCRPVDEWNPITGIRLALDKALYKMVDYTAISYGDMKELKRDIYEIVVPEFKIIQNGYTKAELKLCHTLDHFLTDFIEKVTQNAPNAG
jgi:hypothetical protein